MSIFDVDFSMQSKILLRPKYRLPKILSFLKCLLAPLDFLRLYRLKYYKEGIGDIPLYNPATTYNRYDVVLWADGGVYYRFTEEELSYPDGVKPADGYVAGNAPPSKYWIKLIDTCIGVDERITYTPQLLSLEYMLNHWFATLNPSFYPTGFWPANYPDKFLPLANKPKIYIVQLATNTGDFYAGLDVNDSSWVGVDNDRFPEITYVGLDSQVTANSFGFVVYFPQALIGVSGTNLSYTALVAANPDPINKKLLYQLEALINKHKQPSIHHGYTSY